MRTFGASFAAQLLSINNRPFWTVVFHYETEDVYVSSRRATIGGNEHTVLLLDVGAIGSAVGRTDPAAMDVLNTDVGFVNVPMRSGLPGQLAAGERLSDRWDRAVETRLAEVFLSIELPDTSIVQELMLPAIMGAPTGAGFIRGNVHLASLSEKYLNASVLRKIQPAFYPFGYNVDNATVPLVIGNAPRTPGRIAKGSSVSVPVAGVANVGTAQLTEIEVSANPGAQIWTLEFVDQETVQCLDTPNSAQAVNLGSANGNPQPLRAQSFTLAAPQTLASIWVKFKTTGTPDTAPGHQGFPLHPIVCELWSDSGGNPGTFIQRARQNVAFSTSYVEKKIIFSPRVDLAAGTYWFVITGAPGARPYGAWTPIVNNSLFIGANSAGTYGGGKAKKGTRPYQTYSTSAVFFYGDLGTYTWDSSLDAYDLWFKLGLEVGTFSLTGSATGPDGSGDPNTDFESNSGIISIPRTSWKGTPQPGDTFVFTTDPSDSLVIFSESPVSGPVEAVNSVYIDGTEIVDTADQTEDYPWGSSFLIAFGYQSVLNPPVKPEPVGIIRSYVVTGTVTFIKIGVRFGKVGFPTNPCRYSILADNDGVPDRTRVLARVDVPLDEILPCAQDGSSGPGFLYKSIPPLTVSNTTIWIMVDTDNFQFGSYNYYLATMSAAHLTDITYAVDVSGALYQTSWHFAYSLIGAGLTVDPTFDDGAGHQIAVAQLDFDIPRNSIVTADVDGVTAGGDVVKSPDDVVHYLLNYAGVDDGDIDLAGAFAASRAYYEAIPIEFHGAVLDDLTFKTLILQLAYECRSVFSWGIAAALRFQPDEYPAPLAALALDDILRDSNHEPVYRFERSTQDELVNSITMKYAPNLSTMTFARTVARFVPDSVSTFGLLERTDRTELKFIRTREAAQAVADWRLMRQAYPFVRHYLTTLLPFLAVESDDPVSLDLTNAAEGGDCMGGIDGTQTLQVEAVGITPGTYTVDLAMRETSTDVQIEDGDGYQQIGTVVVLLDQGDLTTLWDYVMGAPPVGAWTSPSTSDGDVYDGISLNGSPAWVLYIENGVRKWKNTGTAGMTLYDWNATDSYPPASIASNQLEIEI